jgi:glycosyltransferase involved in cell wall biosynthesis
MTNKFKCSQILPVAEGSRPLWSVMIPTYNNIDYLAQTLESVLAQDPGVDQMQIEVVDNASTEGDIEAFVKQVGKGRVDFHSHPQSVGGCMHNFNACIRRSRGQLVHILHSDDYVEPGFYAAYTQAAETHPQAALLTCRVFDVDEQGQVDGLSPRLRYLEEPLGDASPQFYVNDIRFPGVVVRRSFYEEVGGFCETIIHAHDWEMWMRAIQRNAALAINRPLANYRVFAGNDSSKLVRTATSLRDLLQVGEVFQQYPRFDHSRFIADLQQRALWKAGDFLAVRDRVGIQHNAKLWWELASSTKKVKTLLKMWVRADKTELKLVVFLMQNWLSASASACLDKVASLGKSPFRAGRNI